MPPEAKTASADRARLEKAAKFGLEDVLMILLALASVTLVLADIFYRPRLIFSDVPSGFLGLPPEGWADTPRTLRAPIAGWEPFWIIVAIDAAITLVFILEFVVKSREYGSVAKYARDNWFDVVGMFPMGFFVALDWYLAGSSSLTLLATNAGARGASIVRLLRFARIIRVITAASRLARAANMTLGEQVVSKVFNKYKAILVAELTTPILLQAISITQGIITRGKYAESVGKELDAKRDEIYSLIIKNLEARKATQTLTQPEFVRAAIRKAEEEILDTVVLTLTSEELNKIIADTVDRVLEDFKRELKKKEWAHVAFNREGVDPGKVADAKETVASVPPGPGAKA